MLKIGVILGSTRDTRIGGKAAEWLMALAGQRTDLAFELIDLRDYALPFFNERASNMHVPTQDPEGLRWQKTRNLTAMSLSPLNTITARQPHSRTLWTMPMWNGLQASRLRGLWIRGRGAGHRTIAADRRGTANGAHPLSGPHSRRRLPANSDGPKNF